MANHLDVKRVHDVRLEHFLEQVMRTLERRVRGEHPQAPRNAVDVRIDRHGRTPEVEEQDDRGRLSADPRQRGQPLARLRQRQLAKKREVPGATGRLVHLGQDVLDALRLGRCQAARAEHVLQLIGWRGQHFGPGRVTLSQRGEGAERIRVSGVLREDRQDQLADGIDPRTGPGRVFIPLAQPLQHHAGQAAALPPVGRTLLRARTARH